MHCTHVKPARRSRPEPIRGKYYLSESETIMASKVKSPVAASVMFTLHDPDEPSKSNHAEVGGTVTWKSASLNYPEFEIAFMGANPFNNTKDARFKGAQDQPVVLELKTSGQFLYVVRHRKQTGECKDCGPFCIGIAPVDEFFGHCKGCPPWGTGI